MQTWILKDWRILAATLLSAVFIVGAYIIATNFQLPQVAQASAETQLLQVIATKDSDSDGLPDWEEALYGTDPHVADTFHLGMTDGEAVARGLIIPKAIANIAVATSSSARLMSVDGSLPPPAASGTLTDAFSKNFFSLYVAAKRANGGTELTSDQTNALVGQGVSSLSQGITPAADFKKASDITVSGSGPDALRAFAIAAEAVLKKNKTNATKSEIEYFQSAVQDGDASALVHLSALAKAYRDSAVGLAVLPVPEELAATHLAIVNSIMRLSNIDSDFARVDTDPFAAMLALNQFRQTELAGEQAFIDLYKIYAAVGVTLPNGTPGASFVNVMINLAAQQQATTKKQ